MSAFHHTREWRMLSARVRKRTTLPATCIRCHGVIHPGEPFDIGHILDAAIYPELALLESNVGPEHRHRAMGCVGNRSAGGTAGARKTNRQKARRQKGEYPNW